MKKQELIDALVSDLAAAQEELANQKEISLMWFELAAEKETQLVQVKKALGVDDSGHQLKKAFRQRMGVTIANDHQGL
jgi:hypothetical protein